VKAGGFEKRSGGARRGWSPDAGPEAAYTRSVLLEELEAALDELPE
jgi:hypothetical protein